MRQEAKRGVSLIRLKATLIWTLFALLGYRSLCLEFSSSPIRPCCFAVRAQWTAVKSGAPLPSPEVQANYNTSSAATTSATQNETQTQTSSAELIIMRSASATATATATEPTDSSTKARDNERAELESTTSTNPDTSGEQQLASHHDHNHQPTARNTTNEREQDPLLAASPPTDGGGGGGGNAADEDVVISSSEILTDNNRQPAAPAPSVPSPPLESTTANCSRPLHETDLADAMANNEQNGGADERDTQHYSNSRLLLRLLVVGLFGLVSMSLTIVYTIKFCVCRRRKRLLRRDLVTDLCLPNTATERSHEILLRECSCSPSGNLASSAAPVSRLQSLFRPIFWAPTSCRGARSTSPCRPYHHQSSVPSIYQQLAIADRLASAGQQPMPLPPINCTSCLAGEPHHQPVVPPPSLAGACFAASRPPAYADLFGRQQVAGEPPSSGVESSIQTSTSALDTTLIDDNSTLQSGIARQQMGPQTSGANSDSQHHRHLLVKLNLNKTKLLSADDLVLLSKLIDVPIVIQQQHHQQQESGDGTSVATIEELDEVIAGDNEGHFVIGQHSTEDSARLSYDEEDD